MWFWFSLSSAILGAAETIINKKTLHKVEPTIFIWSVFTLSLPILAYLAFKNGIPDLNQLFVIGVTGSAISFGVTKAITTRAIKTGVLSKLLPLATFNVLFTYILGLVFLSETIAPIPVFGLILIIIGAYILNAENAKEDFLSPFKVILTNKMSFLFLIAIFLSSVSAIFDKTAINNTFPTNVFLVIFVEQLIMTVFFTIYMLNSQRNWVKEFKQNFWLLLFNSLLYIVISILAYLAISEAPVALAAGVKRSQILFALIFGIFFLNDRPNKYTWIAVSVMVIGVLLIKLWA